MTINMYRAAIIVLLIAVATLTGFLFTHHSATASSATSGNVSSFNDGFATSKQDDCQQGFQAACAWLRSN